MSREPRTVPNDDERPRPGESLMQRLHRRKTEARLADGENPPAPVEPATAEDGRPERAPVAEATDADMPPLESLTGESDYRGFLSSRVSEPLRRAALRKLFHSAEFNVIDELDDYTEDFAAFTSLGDLVTAEMRHRIEAEAERVAERLAQGLEDEAPAGHVGPARSATAPAAPDPPAQRLAEGGTAAAPRRSGETSRKG